MRRRGSGRHANRRLVGRQRTPKHHDNADKTKEGARRESPIQFSLSMLSTLVVALFILTFNVQAFEIPTGSMEPTLLVGDHVLVDRADVEQRQRLVPFLPHHRIRHGDILVFLSPAQPELHLVKRVIGVPGDHIRLENGTLVRNGRTIPEPYVIRNGTYSPYRDNFPTLLPSEEDGLTRSGKRNSDLISMVTRSSFLRVTTSQWATIVITATTADIGVSSPRQTSLAVP